MADILIKNIELPKEGRLVLAICPNGHIYRYYGEKYIETRQEALFDSDAIALREHGDLIDKQELAENYDCIKPKDSIGREQYDTLMGYEVYNMIENAPVIIPSNREGQNNGD